MFTRSCEVRFPSGSPFPVAVLDAHKHALIYRSEELPYVAFQDPESACVVLAFFIRISAKCIHRFVRSLPPAARIRVARKRPVEKRIELSIESVVHEPITNRGLMDITRLWVANLKMVIEPVPVRSRGKVGMKNENIP